VDKTKKFKLDDKDIKIVNALYSNSRLSCREISRKTKIPVMTVLNRMKKLEEEGVILEYTIRVDAKKLGFFTLAYIIVTIDYTLLNELKITQQDVCDQIVKHSNVSMTDLITGPDRDLLIKVKAKSINELSRILDDIRLIRGISRTDTMTILYEARKECISNQKFKKQKTLI